MRRLSEAAYRLKGQEMFKILARAKELEKEGKKILHFELGDPGFPSPDIALQEIYSSIKNGETHYTISSGIDDLRNQVSIFIENSRGFRPDKEQVLITPGANIQIFYAVACIANPGDEVIVPDPGFVSYFSIIDFCGVKAVRVPLREENNFRLNPQDVENARRKNNGSFINKPPF